MKRILMIFCGLALMAGCQKAAVQAENAVRPGETRDNATTQEGDTARMKSETIAFVPGTAALDQAAKDKIRRMVDAMRADGGKIDKVKIAAWSDKEFAADKDLPRGDRRLAEARLKAINDYLKNDLDVSDTDTFNMAERSNWLARTMGTEDAELKGVFARNDAPVSNDEFDLIKKSGGPSHAILVSRDEH